jgi:hypothetical protein
MFQLKQRALAPEEPATYHHHMGRILPTLLLLTAALAHAQQPAAPPALDDKAPDLTAPLPDIRQLVLDVERNQRAAEATRKDYTYHVHVIEENLDKNGAIKKTATTDSDVFTIDGVPVDRTTAKNGKPLTPDEQKKESDRIDKEVAKAKERRAKLDSQGKDSNARGDQLIPASRILELGTFTNPRRILLNGRPTIVADYSGDPHAKTRNSGEAAIRDLVGTAWFDEHDRTLVQGEGHFLNDFKLGAGLVLNIHKGFSFSFQTVNVNGEVWLPKTIDARGEARILLLDHIDGHLHLDATDYRKFRSSSKIVGESAPLGPDDQPLPASNPLQSPPPTTPTTPAPSETPHL